MNIVLTRNQLLTRLNSQLAVAQSHDVDKLVAHRAENKRIATERRDALKKLINMPDNELAEASVYDLLRGKEFADRNQCPRAIASDFLKLIAIVELDNRVKYTIKDDSYEGMLLTWSPDAPKRAVC